MAVVSPVGRKWVLKMLTNQRKKVIEWASIFELLHTKKGVSCFLYLLLASRNGYPTQRQKENYSQCIHIILGHQSPTTSRPSS